jgi:WD40 repeat protein
VDNSNVSYLQVPSVRRSQKLDLDLPGNRFHIVVWENLLLSIDFVDNCRLRFYFQSNIISTAWVRVDERLSVMTDQGLFLVTMDEFKELDRENGGCFWSDVDLKHTILSAGDLLERNTKMVRLVSYAVRKWLSSDSMSYLTYDLLFRLSADNGMFADNRATIVTISNDGKTAVAYEGNNAITVYDAMDNPLIVIDKLELAVYDNILKICFSPDSKYLLIWRNYSIVVIDVANGKYMLKLNVALRPALDVSFIEDDQLRIMLCNQKEYIFACTAGSHAFKCQHQFPDTLVDSVDMDRHSGPYSVYPNSGRIKPLPLLHAGSFDNLPHINLRTICAYYGLKHWILFLNGEFYLDGSTDRPFSHPYCDFNACIEGEHRSETAALHGYLRDKNDMMSVLFEPDERHLVLVCRRLNTVLVFDMEKVCVSAAYKVDGNIIGIKSISNKLIELVRDAHPMRISIELRLP